MSRLSLASEAVRPSMKGRVLIAGPPGSGKTKTALSIATVLAEGSPFLGIDTEDGEMLTYAISPDNPSGFEFQHLPWSSPFDIVDLTDTIKEAGREFPVIVIDSMFHFWSRTGGILDMVDGRFGGWKGVRPLQQALTDAIKQSPAHILMCVRSKVAYAQETDDRTKKQVVRKLGMEIKFDAELESEVQVFLEMDMGHTISVSKSRSDAVPVGRTWAPHQERDFATGYGEWLRAGDPFADIEEQVRVDTECRNLDPDKRRELWDLWQRHALPKAENMTATHVEIADKLIAQVKAGPKARGRAAGSGQDAASKLRAAAEAETAPPVEPAPAEPAADVAPEPVAAADPEPPVATAEPESFPESQGDPFTGSDRPVVKIAALRKSLIAEAVKQFSESEYERICSVAHDGVPFDRITNDELRGLLFSKAS